MAFVLHPSYFENDWWDSYDYPTSIMHQLFGDALADEDLLPPSYHRGFILRPRSQANIDASGKSEVENDAEEFKISLNVSQFEPEDLEVKIVDDFVVVHGKHEEKEDEFGYIAREFKRRYMLPKGCDQEKITSTLTPEGTLVIQAPKIKPPELGKPERQIPILLEKPIDD